MAARWLRAARHRSEVYVPDVGWSGCLLVLHDLVLGRHVLVPQRPLMPPHRVLIAASVAHATAVAAHHLLDLFKTALQVVLQGKAKSAWLASGSAFWIFGEDRTITALRAQTMPGIQQGENSGYIIGVTAFGAARSHEEGGK